MTADQITLFGGVKLAELEPTTTVEPYYAQNARAYRVCSKMSGEMSFSGKQDNLLLNAW